MSELPPDSKVISVVPSGSSEWVHTVRIEVRQNDDTNKSYFMKMSHPTLPLLMTSMLTYGVQSQSGELGRSMMEGAFHSESLFHAYVPDHVPKPYAWGTYKASSTSFYISDFHDFANEVPVYQELVPIIVKVHKDSM